MEKIFSELERKVERVASVIDRLKEENSKLRSGNQELNQRLRELKATDSGSDGTSKQLKSRIAQLESERDSLIELKKRVETRLEAILSQFEWLER
jgi:regulator of replication initiation timing